MKLSPLLLATGSLWLATGLPSTTLPVALAQQQTQPNLLQNPQFDGDGTTATGWTAFEGGYTLVPKAGNKSSNAVTMTRQDGDKARGISQFVLLDQKNPAPITLSGWSRAQNVSGTPDNNYAVFTDLTYADGTNGWGFFAPFDTGTTDWKAAQTEIKPEKAVKSLTFYALFREHTGQVWFSDLKVSTPGAQVAAPLKLVEVQGQKIFPDQPFKATIPPDGAVMKVVPMEQDDQLVNSNWDKATLGIPTGWQRWGDGFTLRDGEGREGSRAAYIERKTTDGERGIFQEVFLNQKVAQPILLSGWSKAENVTGTPDADYSLYADLTFHDGTQQWGDNATFVTGTHDWQQAKLLVAPDRPVKSIRFYALFRGHTGKVWFSSLSLGLTRAPLGAVMFDSQAVKQLPTSPVWEVALRQPTVLRTTNGLALEVGDGGRVTAVKLDGRDLTSGAIGGFLVRDVANASDYHPLKVGRNEALQLQLESQIRAEGDHLVVEGRVADLSGKDRAISLVFALPIEARGWQWGQTIRESQPIGDDELSNTVAFFAGSNGQHSLYPVANIHDAKSGLAIALDPNFAAQNRLAVNGATQQFYVAYDFGLTAEKSDARFRFVLYRTDPQWGFRDALAKMGRIFPGMFAVTGANRKQGLWMPFTDVREVKGWQDFGFRYREANATVVGEDSLKWDDQNDILSFRYHEPMTWWMDMPAGSPRTYENALAQLQRAASDPKAPTYQQAKAVLSSGFRDTSGRYAVSFRDMPWSSGAVWSLNPDPKLVGESTGASLGWSAATGDRNYKNNPKGDLDGEYLDSLEGYVTSNLNYDRDQFKVAQSPLTFDTATSQPAQHKALLVYDYTRWESKDVRSMGKLMFANSVPYRFTFLTPWLDVMGTETNWLQDGKYSPESDAIMSLRRSMSGAKPYLLLQNTDFDKFTTPYVEKYMQRSLFYGMFPGFFSADAANKPYWLNPVWYNRDRPLFKKYLPIIKPVAEAGWQAVTLATSDNPNIWVERFGAPGGPIYLTLRNNATSTEKAQLRLQAPLVAPAQLKDLVSGQTATVKNGVIGVSLQSDQTMVLKLR